jgi:hypothetical protein
MLGILAFTALGVAAQTATSAPTTGGMFTGKITKTNPLTVNSNGQDRQVNLAPNAVITRGGNTITANDLKVGDQVNVTSNPDNSVSRVDVTNTASAFPAWLIPLIIALIVLALLAWLLSRRRRTNDFVLEPNRTPPTQPRQ